MRTAGCPNRWKTLYRDAILETNKGLLPQRVSEAEEAVKARGREIFYGNGTAEEEKGSRSIGRRTLYLACVQNRSAAQRRRVIAYLGRDDAAAMNER